MAASVVKPAVNVMVFQAADAITGVFWPASCLWKVEPFALCSFGHPSPQGRHFRASVWWHDEHSEGTCGGKA